MLKTITIAIDGFSSTGKSTVAKQLANKLKYIYVDTGAMYRAITLFAMQHDFIGTDKLDKEAIIAALPTINISFKYNESVGFAEVYLNDTNVEKEIRTLHVSQFVSIISTISEVRRKLVAQQQEMGKEGGIVMDGRDIGTVVFPTAELKLFMTASAEKRGQRRYDELIERGDDVNLEEIVENVVKRDHIDSTREDSPLVKADDAIEFDNSDMTLVEQFEKILALVERVIKN
ncbi:MAG: cytidylate kinase [Flavobacteriaceae bacterium]|nr:MAG: cytidylate kinase [Flavobacteriaceae bacterium]